MPELRLVREVEIPRARSSGAAVVAVTGLVLLSALTSFALAVRLDLRQARPCALSSPLPPSQPPPHQDLIDVDLVEPEPAKSLGVRESALISEALTRAMEHRDRHDCRAVRETLRALRRTVHAKLPTTLEGCEGSE